METNARVLGISQKELDKLRIVHVTGTKGKGSTCAFTESILRNHGLKVGMYTSPHLVSVTERIKVGGNLISEVGKLPSFYAKLVRKNLVSTFGKYGIDCNKLTKYHHLSSDM